MKNIETQTPKRIRKTQAIKPVLIPGNYKTGGTIETLFPELPELFSRLEKSGLAYFKFDFGFSLLTKPSKRIVIVSKYNAPSTYIGSFRSIPTQPGTDAPDYLKSYNFKIGAKQFTHLFPELQQILTGLTKNGFGNYRLNFSYAHINKPQTRFETIIKINAPATFTD